MGTGLHMLRVGKDWNPQLQGFDFPVFFATHKNQCTVSNKKTQLQTKIPSKNNRIL